MLFPCRNTWVSNNCFLVSPFSRVSPPHWDNLPSPLIGWLVVLRIYVALAVFQPYRDLEAGDAITLETSNLMWFIFMSHCLLAFSEIIVRLSFSSSYAINS